MSSSVDDELVWTIHVMAMPFTVRMRGVPDRDVAERAVRAFADDLADADLLFSLWRPDTPMALIALGTGSVEDAPREIREVLALAEEWRARTGGAFDARLRRRAAARLPVEYPEGAPDPTGIVKTWAVARALAHLEEAAARSWMVDAAGDVCVGGEGVWTVGIADPTLVGDPHGSRPVGAVELGHPARAMATSGVAQARDHVWDPETGEPARHYLQVTVVGDDLIACDAWATAIVAGGPRSLASAVEHGVAALAITAERSGGGFEAVVTPAWPDEDA